MSLFRLLFQNRFMVAFTRRLGLRVSNIIFFKGLLILTSVTIIIFFLDKTFNNVNGFSYNAIKSARVLSFINETSNITQKRMGILYPQESESREVKSLDGIWNFRLAPRLLPDTGFLEQWYAQPLEQTGQVDLMPVPSSYNDITQNKDVRDHVGWAWYDRTFWVPKGWETNKRIFLRFGAAHYQAIVYVNGVQVVEHSGGALPFLAELGESNLNFNGANRITVAINNILSDETIPQGYLWQPYLELDYDHGFEVPHGFSAVKYEFDFFNYAGIHRPIFLYSTPKSYIDDIDVTPLVNKNTGFLSYSVKIVPPSLTNDNQIEISLEDEEGHKVASSSGADGDLVIRKPKLWWPITMVRNDSDAGYLYTFVAKLISGRNVIDVYRLKVGIRTLKWNRKQFLINNKPFYFRGFGRHEDSNIRGKGVDNVMLVKDHNLIKWIGANSYRTSHYPYSEEVMDLADRLGIVIIDETASVSTSGFSENLFKNHKTHLTDLIQRDKNRASVVLWSVANEPKCSEEPSEDYFRKLIGHVKSLDMHRRPVTLVTAQSYNTDLAAKFVDIIGFNRYYGWYTETGSSEIIRDSVIKEVQNWVNTFDKPVFMAEYGADTISGMHSSPEASFTEEFQTKFMIEHFKAFDFLRQNTSFIGEQVWNFADFQTAQGYTRVNGNKKGVFSRDRQPKSSAHVLRLRYHLLAAELHNYPVPQSLADVMPIFSKSTHTHDEI